ncbi:MAG: hypothetical protein KAI83_04590 [Thiomargarita sp.]|nr:hypothetical protein [Thiomargarita sp.]
MESNALVVFWNPTLQLWALESNASALERFKLQNDIIGNEKHDPFANL